MKSLVSTVRLLGLGLLSASLIAGCGGGDYGGYGGGDLGATVGGVKDLRLARELIANGQVPPADALLPEAMFAEHDLPLTGDACATTLCLRAAAGFAADTDGSDRAWLQVGLSSAIDPATWQRPPTTFVFTVDVSGSMGWDYSGGEYPSPGNLARATLHQLTDQLTADDQVAIVTYGESVRTAMPLTSGSERARIHAVIDGLDSNGSTNMEAGITRAMAIGQGAVQPGREVRMVLFTDEQPNVGATTESAFATMIADGAADGVHTTVLAYGLGIGAELLRGMSTWPGANAFSMLRNEDVSRFMADEWPYFAAPIGYDLRVNLTTQAPWSIERAFGFPAADDGIPGLKAATIFLSRRRGALLVALDPGAAERDSLDAGLDLSYRDADGVHTTHLDVDAIGAPTPLPETWFAQQGVARTTALALLTEGMHDAALAYETSHDLARRIIERTETRFVAEATALGDEDLQAEVALVGALRQLMISDAPQGSLY